MCKEHTPKKHSPKMICLSTDKNLRKELISYYKYLCGLAKHVLDNWKLGNTKEKIPPGLYPPRMPTLVSSIV